MRSTFSFAPFSFAPLGFLLLFLLVAGHAAERADAWTREGHEVIGVLADDLLSEAARAEVASLLAVLAAIDPQSEDLAAASTWLDQLRHRGLETFDRWHYVNLPINPDGLPLPPPHPDDVLFAIRESVETLEDPRASRFGRAFALRVLLHAVGDVHQPLHTVSRFSADHPRGDRGGNDFPVAAEGRVDTLHLLWDHGVGLLVYPAARDHDQAVRRLAAAISRAVPPEELPEKLPEIGRDDPLKWAEEGRRVAIEVVYEGIEEGERPSDAYVQRALPVVRRRLVLAAHRLAALLNGLFET